MSTEHWNMAAQNIWYQKGYLEVKWLRTTWIVYLNTYINTKNFTAYHIQRHLHNVLYTDQRKTNNRNNQALKQNPKHNHPKRYMPTYSSSLCLCKSLISALEECDIGIIKVIYDNTSSHRKEQLPRNISYNIRHVSFKWHSSQGATGPSQ